MSPQIGLLDYGMGNLYSVQQAFTRLNSPIEIVKTTQGLKTCKALILPGVGAFDPAIKNLSRTGLIPDLKEWVRSGKPLLGICLGLQLLFDGSDEGSEKGLGLFKGRICKLPKSTKERIPHMGWSPIKSNKVCPLIKESLNSNWMYFVHSYSAIPKDDNDLAATTSYGENEITAMVWRENIGACQFHPEKSGKAGQRILLNWIEWINKEF